MRSVPTDKQAYRRGLGGRRLGLLGALALAGHALVAAATLSAGAAQAQQVPYGPFEAYPTLVFREGPGFRVLGDGLVLHPGLSAELGYDSNVLMSSVSGGAGVLRLRAHLDLATLPPQRLDAGARPKLAFRLGAGLEYRQFMSADDRVGGSQQVNAWADADVHIRPHEPLSLRLGNKFLVTNDARNLEVAGWQTFAPRIYDQLSALGVWKVFGGPLELGLSESFRVDHFVQSELSSLRSLANDIDLYGQLRVLPQTQVRLEVRSQYISYYNSNGVIPSSAPLRIQGGVQTLLWSWLGASAYVGYGNSLTLGTPVWRVDIQQQRPTRYSNFVGGLEARLHRIQRMKLAVGWARDFFDSIYATYYKDDRIYANYEHNVWRSLSLRAQLEFYVRSYGALYDPTTLQFMAVRNGKTTRDDLLVTFGVEATYRPLTWLEVGASYTVLNDSTDFVYLDGVGTPIAAAFTKHVLLFRADLAY